MSRPIPLGWALVGIVLALAIGVAIGGGFCMRQADGVIAEMHARDKENIDRLMAENAKLRGALESSNTANIILLDRVHQDEATCPQKSGIEGSLAFKVVKP